MFKNVLNFVQIGRNAKNGANAKSHNVLPATPAVPVQSFATRADLAACYPAWMGRSLTQPQLLLAGARCKSTKWPKQSAVETEQQEPYEQQMEARTQPQGRRQRGNKGKQSEGQAKGMAEAAAASEEEEDPVLKKQRLEKQLKSKMITERLIELMKARVAYAKDDD